LASTKQYLESVIEEHQATTEELKSANEEVQSSNEELQSTNEELLTAKEELQSTNEELTTVNEEMHSRNAELSQINNDLNNLLSSVNIPIVMVGNDLRIRRFTPHAEKVLNLLPSDVGRPISDFRPKIDIPNLELIFLDVIESLRVHEREVQDRAGRSFSMWVRPYRTADNKIDGAVMVLLDVTERKQTAEARYRRLFEAARDGIILADGETGEIIELNPYMAKTFGISRSASIGIRYWELDVFRGTELDAASFAELQSTEFARRTILATTKTGGRLHAEAIANLYLEGDRRVVQLNLRLVPERRRSEEPVRREHEEAEPSSRLRPMMRLVAALSRDFNNLLTTLPGYAERMRRKLGPEDALADDVEQIARAAERAGRLARQLLAFGSRQIAQPEVLSLNDVVEEMRHVVGAMLPPLAVLTVELDPRASPVKTDCQQIESVLLNLVVNARETIRARGKVRISTFNLTIDTKSKEYPAVPPGQYSVLEVSDSVTESENAIELFDPFFTGKPSDVVGIHDIYRSVRQCGGFLWAWSELGRGSTFRILLPRAAEPLPATLALERALPRGSGTVLILEEDDLLRGLAARTLRDCGYEVLETASGPEAVKTAQERSGIDLLLA
jgi:two-component system CheB/CheR fusion protein